MQDPNRRSNKERSETMRAALLATGRALFVQHGFGTTATPEIVAAAGVTRGALYHHFADKAALFDAVVMHEAEDVAEAIRSTDYAELTPVQALIRGGEAYLAAMQVPGRTQLLLVDAPAVLGLARLAEIDAATGGGTLVEGLQAVLPEPELVPQVAALLSAAFDRAALAVAAGEDASGWNAALTRLITGLSPK